MDTTGPKHRRKWRSTGSTASVGRGPQCTCAPSTGARVNSSNSRREKESNPLQKESAKNKWIAMSSECMSIVTMAGLSSLRRTLTCCIRLASLSVLSASRHTHQRLIYRRRCERPTISTGADQQQQLCDSGVRTRPSTKGHGLSSHNHGKPPD
ncbi:hypothetical protein CBL_12698 [Carabus blaptoides fortunei]